MKRYLKDLENELNEYRPQKPLIIYARKLFGGNNSKMEIIDGILEALKEEFKDRVICIENVGTEEINYECFEIKKEDMNDLEKGKNAKYRGIINFELFEDEIIANTLYEIMLEDGSSIPLEVEYEATKENLLAFLSNATEKNLKYILDFIRKDKMSK